MNNSSSIELQPETLAAVQAMAAERCVGLDAVVNDALQRGLSSLRQDLFFEERLRRAGDASVEEALEILRGMGKGNPPDPGDEIPEDLKEWVESRRAARRP